MNSPFAEVSLEYAQLQEQHRLRPNEIAVATFAGGCFWCMEGPFEAMPGVLGAVVGYAGGHIEHPSYEQVISDTTGHREGVQVFYESAHVSYRSLLDTFFWNVDPTDPGGQFHDRGEHYTTAVYYHTPEQQELINTKIADLAKSGLYDKPIVTLVKPFTTFYPAEDYHQQFYQKQAEYYQRYKEGSGRAGYIEAMQAKYREST